MDKKDSEKRRDVSTQIRSSRQNVQRRSSKKSSSQDRHGKIFSDGPREHTVRAVTPESPSSVLSTPGLDAGFLPSPTPTSPRARLQNRRRELSDSLSNEDEETTLETRRRKSTSKAKFKDDVGSDASPNSFISKTRHKLEAITTSAPFAQRSVESIGSIGFPSVIQSPSIPETDEQRPRANTTSGRTFSQTSVHRLPQGSLRSPLVMDPDSSKILHLMKTTCGRMHGILFFRPSNSDPWASGYCAINVAPGSLVCQVKGDIATTKTLIPDLRGCIVRTHYDAETQSTYLSVVTASSGVGFQLRPPVPETFDSWLAALLCWQPLRPKGLHNRMTKPQSLSTAEKRPSGQTRTPEASQSLSNAIIKIGRVLLWDGSLPPPPQRTKPNPNSRLKSPKGEHSLWRRVGCTLHENGQFKLLAESDAALLSEIPLPQLSRSAVQQLHFSVLDKEFCVAIFPQYSPQPGATLQPWPLFLAFESRTAFEVWFVLFRAFAVPELYGPEQHIASSVQNDSHTPDQTRGNPFETMFRVERSLSIRVTEARLTLSSNGDSPHGRSRQTHTFSPHQIPEDYYAEILLDRDLRARTATKSATSSVFWAEEFQFEYLPSVLSKISILVKVGNPAEREWTMVAHGPYDLGHNEGDMTNAGRIEISSHDTVYGKIDLQLDDLLQRRDVERRWPMTDKNNHAVGDLLMKVNLREIVVLMQEQYAPLSDLLHNFSNSLTPQIAQVLSAELKQLSETLLDIFQVSGSVSEWINNLIEEEIDGIYKATPARLRFTGRTHSTDSYESGERRELLVRDLNRSANNEANLLFRGNSLATKALDAHMRRLGKEYLDESIGSIIREIIDRDPDCEVNPIHIKSPEQLERNWGVLNSITTAVWKSIYDSAARCPSGLRVLFKHVRSCAEDRYGGFIRTVKYTSVSGFLFLRLFCPAILNPELFGLLRDRPPERPRRTLTLVAKSLIVLANMGKFGAKEPWMEPMNKFLVTATPDFKTFIDQICSITSSQALISNIDPQNTTPMQISARLPPTSREGFPSLPYLLDSAKLFANLVTLWMDHSPTNIVETGVEDCVKTFHEICTSLQQRSRECLNNAEQAGRPDGGLESKWQQLLVERQKDTALGDPFEDEISKVTNGGVYPSLAQISGGKRQSTRFMQRPGPTTYDTNGDEETTPPSSASMGWDQRRPPFTQGYAAESRGDLTRSTNSSNLSLELVDESRSRFMPGSRDGQSKNRLLDLVGLPNRRKGKQAGGNQSAGEEGNEF